MDKLFAIKYYSRPEIQKALLKFAKDREIGLMYNGFFGKRPEVLENLADIRTFVKKGVFSFHSSEERWLNPLILSNHNLSDDEKQKNRLGWDLILDLDGIDFIFSKIVGEILLRYISDLGVKNVSVKFSGNKGFHIGVPFEAFSSNIIGIGDTRKLFPEIPRRIAAFLMHELKNEISSKILDYFGSIENLCDKYSLDKEDLFIDDIGMKNFNFMKVIEIDTVLISSRHLFRMPYSLHEKSSLVSIPVKKDSIMDFEKFLAKPDKVDPIKYSKFDFLSYNSVFGKDADILVVKSYEEDLSEEFAKSVLNLMKSSSKENQKFEINEEVALKDFPPTIKFVLGNKFSDGRKRALFLLLTFLYSINWKEDSIEELVNEWNIKQSTPLKENYIKGQFSWFKLRQKDLSPPNYDNDAYYKNIGITEDLIFQDQSKFKKIKIKNPLHYVYLLLQKKR